MLETMLNPKSVAVIGASRNPNKVGYKVLANLVNGGYKGEIVPVNPKADGNILGLKCYSDLKEYDGKIDQSIIVIPARFSKAAIESSIAAGATAINIITAGFKEMGPEGAALEKEIVAICRPKGVRVLGPNCLGLINVNVNLNASFATQTPTPGNISFITQSGALCSAILDFADANDVGFSKVLTIGNKADLSETDFLSVLAEDESTNVVVAYLESINEGAEFMKAASTAAKKKPIVIFKSGVTSAGTKAASSHTGSLAGADVAYEAAFKQCGVVRAHSYEQMFDYAVGFAGQPLPKGDRVAIVTNAGGPGIMAADAVELSGMTITSLESKRAEALKAQLPAAASVNNPIDVLGDAAPERYVTAINAAQDDENVDGIIVILTPQAVTQTTETAQAIVACARGEKPILTVFMGGTEVAKGNEVLRHADIPNYTSPDRAVATLKAMVSYQAWKQKPARELASFDVDKAKVKAIIKQHTDAGTFQINEVNAKEIFRAYGMNVAAGKLVTTAGEAAKAAETIGYPLVMKIVSPDVLHKSDMGGVKLNLKSADEVSAAFETMMSSIQAKLPQADLKGVYLEKMCKSGGREVIIGMTRDPQFGPMIMFGLGGIFVEVMKDVVFNIAPITADESMAMMKSIKSFPLLAGVRGQAGVNLEAISQTIQRMSQLVTDFPEIKELDINPFIAGATSEDSVAADARITLLGK